MAARSPRRTFAAPFVVTMATLPACYVQTAGSGSTAPNPPPQEPQAQAQTGTSASTGVIVANPPPPPPQTPAQPQPVQAATTVTWNVWKTASGGYQATTVFSCPPRAMCNPPPPVAYTPPTGFAMDKFQIDQDGSVCTLHREPMTCPAGAVCNPPRPQTMPCPGK